MPAMFEQGFFVREPAWHGLGTVLDDYPDRETAMRLAGHDWDVVERELLIVGENDYPEGQTPLGAYASAGVGQPVRPVRQAKGWKAHLRSDTGELLHVSRETYERIPNSVAYEVAELLFDQGFDFETGITLDGGKLCAITLRLNEPIVITGDNTTTLPFGCLSWAHDGSASLRVRSGTIRQVCANTVSASEAEGARLGTDFTFRHTKNVRERIEEAKQAIRGVRDGLVAYRDVMEELALVRVTPEQRELFVDMIVGNVAPDGTLLTANAATTDRVKTNIETAKTSVLSLFMGDTIPEAHALTGYGLFAAGVEYFDHLRAARSDSSYVKRQLITHSPAKAGLTKTIRELVGA